MIFRKKKLSWSEEKFRKFPWNKKLHLVISWVYQADERKMQFMVNKANKNTFLGIYEFLLRPLIFHFRRSSYRHHLLLALFSLAKCEKVWRVQTYLLVYGPSLMVHLSRQQGHCKFKHMHEHTQKWKFHYTEQLLNEESERRLHKR